MKIEKLVVALTIIFLVFAIDRFTKYISLFLHGCFIFCIKRSLNYGAAFNLLQGFSWTRTFLIIVALVVLAVTAYFYFTIPKFNSLHLGLVLLFAGTLANLFDRIFYGYVVDWLTLSFFPLPAMNIADVSNVAGIVLIILLLRKQF